MASLRQPDFLHHRDKNQFDNKVGVGTTLDNRTNKGIQTNKDKDWDYNWCRSNYSLQWVVVDSDLIQHPMVLVLLHWLNNCQQIPVQTSSSLPAFADRFPLDSCNRQDLFEFQN